MKEKKATAFEFTSYQFEPEKKRVVFHYKTLFNYGEALHFTETILLPETLSMKKVPPKTLRKLLEALHLVLGISYYKFYYATKFSVPYTLTRKEANFFNLIYQKGLGEFLYQNQLNPKYLPTFSFDKNAVNTPVVFPKTGKYLVGIGGGKDSIVVAELLKQAHQDQTLFHVATNQDSQLIQRVMKVIGEPQLEIKRHLDWQVSQKHYYNGHVPVSAIYAFLGTLSAVLYGFDGLIVGNEYSSNFGNLHYRGLEINHQWSKSLEFEMLFQDYLQSSIGFGLQYFSLLRGFYEIRIIKLFTQYPKYFSTFSSCNGNFKFSYDQKNLWCGQCAKCVFAFLMLSAFLTREQVINIFGKNLYQDENLLPIFKDILGLGNMKPFDCVGTFAEAQSAMFLAKKNFRGDIIIEKLSDRIVFDQDVFKTYPANNVPAHLRFLGLNNALIVGYGKEGVATEQYLKNHFPQLTISITDVKNGIDYLKHQTDFDIAIKSPGIKKEEIKIPYTTATNLFFSQILGKHLIIGVTGSKGKSTTSSLIFHILNHAGLPVVLLGNIGKPMIEFLQKPIAKGTIFVLELSSYQLDDIQLSPDIAVVTNLFPEHLDFHGTLARYYNAKKNIIHFQNPQNYFVYNEKSQSWVKNYQGKAIKFSTAKLKSNLLGEHNQRNVGAAFAVAKILKIPTSIIKKALLTFTGLPHRLEKVGEFKQIIFYDDAISTTPESTIEAIKTLKKVGTILLGGQDRGYDFTQLEKIIRKYKIKNIVLFPDSGEKIIKNDRGLNILKTSSMKEAVDFAFKYTPAKTICLLSCASPSYSLWKNFEEKGEQFKSFIQNEASH